MRHQLTFFAFIGVVVAVNAGFTCAADDTGADKEMPQEADDGLVRYEITNEEGEVQVHEVNKKLVEEERQAVQAVEEVNKKLAEEERQAVQAVEHIRLLLLRIFDIKQELYSEEEEEQELDPERREQLLEELSVKTAALREILRKNENDENDIRLIRLMEYLVVDVGMDVAVAVSKIGTSLANLYKELSP